MEVGNLRLELDTLVVEVVALFHHLAEGAPYSELLGKAQEGLRMVEHLPSAKRALEVLEEPFLVLVFV